MELRAMASLPAMSPAADRTLVMGIVNVTPDSFSDGGQFLDAAAALQQAQQLIEEGADVLDIGAESTRPGSAPISPEEEWRRLKPVLTELCGQMGITVSVDTYHARTAARALEAGAIVINDIWGGLADPDMLHVVAEAGCTYIWMHNRPQPAEHPVRTLIEETEAGVARCLDAGIAPERLWIDPGIGFGKTYMDNLSIMKHLAAFCGLSHPVLLGASRKSMIGKTLDAAPRDRLEGSLAAVALGVQAGVRAVRVHDVRATVRVCRMVEAIVHAQ